MYAAAAMAKCEASFLRRSKYCRVAAGSGLERKKSRWQRRFRDYDGDIMMVAVAVNSELRIEGSVGS
jgi:hypothetical protein